MHSGNRWVALIKRLATALLLLLAACASPPSASPAHWQSPLYLEHPLVGSIWDSASDRFIDAPTLASALARASYVLLGEKHDNPDHHRLQLQLLDGLLSDRRVATLAFEMLDSSAQTRLDLLKSERLATLEELKAHLEWDEAGWDWDFYGPLVQAGYEARVRLVAANIDSDTMRAVYGAELAPEIASVLDAEVSARLHQDVDESHCGLLPASQFPAMVRVQQSRDNAMARALGGASAEGVNVLVAGNYHVRRDLGIPNYLLRQQSGLDSGAIVSVALIEVQPEITDPAAYLEQFNGTRAYDFIWFTPAVSDEDYCASLRSEE